MIKSILWDVDGTMAETERDGYLKAFNQAFEALSLPWRWSEQRYGELLAIAGGRERLLHDLEHRRRAPESPRQRRALADRVHRLKNELYARIVADGELPLREGVRARSAEKETRSASLPGRPRCPAIEASRNRRVGRFARRCRRGAGRRGARDRYAQPL